MWVCRWEKGAVNPTRGKMGGATWTNRTGTIPPPLPFEGPPAGGCSRKQNVATVGGRKFGQVHGEPGHLFDLEVSY